MSAVRATRSAMVFLLGLAMAVAASVWPASAVPPGTLAASSTSSSTASATTSEVGFVPVQPARILDTRLTGTSLSANGSLSFAPLGLGGVPALDPYSDSAVVAVAINVIAVNPKADGYLRVHLSPGEVPLSRAVDFFKSKTASGQIIVPTHRSLPLVVTSTAATDVVIDVTGYFLASNMSLHASGSSFVNYYQVRYLDTRKTGGMAAGSVATLGLTGNALPDKEDIAAVQVFVLVMNPAAAGQITVYPSGVTRPNVTTVSYPAGKTTSAMVLAPTGSDGNVNVYTSARSNVVVDVMGYMRTGADYRAVTPFRLADTQSGLGVTKAVIPAGGSVDVQVTGKGGVPAMGVSAVEATVTASHEGKTGRIIGYPTGSTRPDTAVVNYVANSPVSNSTSLKVGANGKITLYSTASSDVTVDVTGYWTTH